MIYGMVCIRTQEKGSTNVTIGNDVVGHMIGTHLMSFGWWSLDRSQSLGQCKSA